MSKAGCLPGDAVYPWADSVLGPFGSEQCNSYVVDLAPLTSSWGNRFGIAPIVKSARSNSTFQNSLLTAQAISRLQARGRAFPFNKDASGDGVNDVSVYSFWNAPGFGINNDPSLNDPGVTIDNSLAPSNQFAVAFAEFGTTDAGASWNGITGALINYRPYRPERLYVTRYAIANNSCDTASNISQFGMGAVDELGNTIFRADDFATANGCGVNRLLEDNVFNVNMSKRDCRKQNIISNDYPGGLFDAPTTSWLVRNSTTTYDVPNLVSASLAGGNPMLIGSNFAKQYVRGTAFPPTADTSHLVGTDHRGAVSFLPHTCGLLGGTLGTAGILEYGPSNTADTIAVWGIDNAGNVVNKLGLVLPASVTDNDTGFSSLGIGVQGEFDHYHSQTAFRGGTSQVGLNRDRNGNLLAAAEVSWPGPGNGGASNPLNYIAVGKLNCASGTVSWTMAGYNDGFGGKPIEDGAGGVIGQMVPLFAVTGGTPTGPSVSAPMMDSFGNVYFLSGAEVYGPGGSEFHMGLLRAVLNDAAFSYKLELLFTTGDIFPGLNSGTDYKITFLSIADTDSVSSSTAFSGNISSEAYLGVSAATYNIPNRDCRTLGGLVINAEITYDTSGTGTFNKCTGAGSGDDESYNVLLYVTPTKVCAGDLNGDHKVDLSDLGIVLANYGLVAHLDGDVDGDGDADLSDLGIVLAAFGQPCP